MFMKCVNLAGGGGGHRRRGGDTYEKREGAVSLCDREKRLYMMYTTGTTGDYKDYRDKSIYTPEYYYQILRTRTGKVIFFRHKVALISAGKNH